MRCAFGLGGNLGDTKQLCAHAVALLGELTMFDSETMRLSPYYRSAAFMPENAPKSWDQDFINQVVTFECVVEDEAHHNAPETLLHHVKKIESTLGRKPREHWAPREIDIDIIAMGTLRYDSPLLTIPHKQAVKRAFVVKPLADIWPQCVLDEAGNNAHYYATHPEIGEQRCVREAA